MSDFYTNVICVGNNILFRGVENGRRVKHKIAYSPTLFLPTNKPTQWKNLQGEYLSDIQPGSIRDCKDFIEKYSDVENFKVYGNTRYEYAFIADEFKGMIDWDQSLIAIDIIDIEVGSENGFPDPYLATEPITAIAVKRLGGKMNVYGCGDFINREEDVTYIKCKDEYHLCKRFLEDWYRDTPDILTGWNIKFFDIPYLYNRFNKILGEEETRKLSPWNYIGERKAVVNGRDMTAYELKGVSCLDYIELYKWYAPGGKSQESYRLDSIAHVELEKNKLSYDEFDNLHQLYRLNFQKFIEYNIVDVRLIEELEDKLKLIELALTLAYDSKTNYDDVFTQVRMWDTLIFNFLGKDNIIVPPTERRNKSEAFEGAYVKVPQIGKHDWVASFDLNSLYPHLIMQYNLSPEMLVLPENYTDEMREVLSQGVSVDKLLDKKINTDDLSDVALTPNGQFFRTDAQGFLPKMMASMYEDRKVYKKKSLIAKQELENEKDASKRFAIEKRIARYNNLQLAKKVCLNSAYGAMGNEFFRFFDLRIALAVTMSGQLSIRWIEKKLNEYMNNLLKTDIDYVIASDTDSIYLNLGPLVEKVYPSTQEPQKVIAFMDKICEDKIQPYIDKSYQELADYVHAYEQKMQMKREALADKAIWTAKKRYIMNVYNNEGVQYAEPHLKVMGLEMVKSSTPEFIRGKMEETIKLMMSGTEEQVQQFIVEFKEEFKKLPAEQVSFPRGIRGIQKYSHPTTLYSKGTPIHVKGAIIYNHTLKQKGLTKKYPLINEGEKIKFSYLKMPNPFKDMVISFPVKLPEEFDLDQYIDYDMQFEKAFLEPIKVVLDCMGWYVEKQSTLEDFFG